MAAGATYEPIATISPNGDGTVTFSSIPATYTDLRLAFVGFESTQGGSLWIKLNADSGSNYSVTRIEGNGTTASSNRQINGDRIYPSSNAYIKTSTTPLFITMDLFSYSGSTFKTSLITLSGDYNGSGWVTRTCSLWRSTSAVNEISISVPGGSGFTLGSVFTLYGIKAA